MPNVIMFLDAEWSPNKNKEKRTKRKNGTRMCGCVLQQHMPTGRPSPSLEGQFGVRLQKHCGAKLVQSVLPVSGLSLPNQKWFQTLPCVACWAHRDTGMWNPMFGLYCWRCSLHLRALSLRTLWLCEKSDTVPFGLAIPFNAYSCWCFMLSYIKMLLKNNPLKTLRKTAWKMHSF